IMGVRGELKVFQILLGIFDSLRDNPKGLPSPAMKLVEGVLKFILYVSLFILPCLQHNRFMMCISGPNLFKLSAKVM
ncbi:hypothetical protein A2U01_0041013, partial [Trifolium medium]|nr:hypothetical protein [Trifolium medium]